MSKPAAIFVVAVCVSMACSAAPTNVAPLAAKESAANMKQEYLHQTAALDPHAKEYRQRRVEILRQILELSDGASRRSEFERLTGESERDAAYDAVLAQSFVEYYLMQNDTNALTKILASRCPGYVGSTPLEYELAARSTKMVLLLPQALRGSSSQSRDAIVACLARAFPALRRTGMSDADFAQECQRWVSQNSQRIILNVSYPHLPSLPPPDPGRTADPAMAGLFILEKD
jgi:hypothetical protein